jgi:hypothetical protein
MHKIFTHLCSKIFKKGTSRTPLRGLGLGIDDTCSDLRDSRAKGQVKLSVKGLTLLYRKQCLYSSKRE